MPEPQPATPTRTAPATTPDTTSRPDTDGGDHDRFAHIVYPADKLTEAMVEGTPIQALCGKVWVPSRNPDNYELCRTCEEVAEELGLDVPGR